MAGPTLTVEVERRFGRGPAITAAFDVDLEGGGTLVLFGPSGSGKTTILRCLAGLEQPDRGRIAADDETWFDAQARIDLPPQRRRVGYLPQGFALFPHLDVRSNIAFGMGGTPAAEREWRIAELVRLLRLDGLEARRAGQLSGGQQQRVALARALARGPRLLLLDEPLSALDTPTRETLRGDLRRLLAASGVPAIVVTHDRSEAIVLGDRVAVIADGAILQIGPLLEVFDQPVDETAARIVGVETVLPAQVIAAAEGLLRLRIGTAELLAVGESPIGADVLVSIRAEDVILVADAVGTSGGVSARNRLAGTVVSIEPAGPLVRVHLDCGFPLVAAVTRPALEELGLHPDRPVSIILKAPSVHVIG
ncbi:MAG: ABC transporter ATP-binding protein [Chloroflexi bacterium]|nr:ABC transporter ATP-binding protein [Chloroflexota bacterium]